MPLISVGKTCCHGEERPLFLLQGSAVRDAEGGAIHGIPHAKVSIAARRGEGDALFVTLNGWRQRAAAVGAIRKHDSVLAFGPLKKTQRGGRTYYDLDADFVSLSGAGLETRRSQDASQTPFSELQDTDGDEIPF